MIEIKNQPKPEIKKLTGTVRNIGEPLLLLNNIENLAGFSAESGQPGQEIKVWTRLSLTSDQPLFHRLVKEISGLINHMANTNIDLHKANTILLVIKPNKIAELWLDTAAVSIRCAVKRPVEYGRVIFEKDIIDINGMMFPCISFGKPDKIICIFRQDWRFGLYFDMNLEGNLNIETLTTELGTLYRELRYHDLYDTINNESTFKILLLAGWFPFVEIITKEFTNLTLCCEADFNLNDTENNIINNFDENRLEEILNRWLEKPHFSEKKILLQEAIDHFKQKKPISVIKIILTEIEGILRNAYQIVHGKNQCGVTLKRLLEFAKTSAEACAGNPNTLLLPTHFLRYLNEYTFANFDPITQNGTAGSRHAVGHGAATQNSYTMIKALQAILTLDQLAFYTSRLLTNH